MRTSLFAAALTLLGLAVPLEAEAFVVVRARAFYHPVAVVAVAAAVAAPVYYPPTTVVVTSQPAPQPAAPPLTTPLPLNTTMWSLPSGCNTVASGAQTFYICGPNWLKAYPGVNGSPTYYGVVAPP